MCTMYWTQERKRRRPYRYETVFLSKSGVQQRGKSHGNQVDVHANAKRLSNRPVHERVLMRSTMVGALPPIARTRFASSSRTAIEREQAIKREGAAEESTRDSQAADQYEVWLCELWGERTVDVVVQRG